MNIADATTCLIIALAALAASGWGSYFWATRKTRLFQLETNRIRAVDTVHLELAHQISLSIKPCWKFLADITVSAREKIGPFVPDIDLESHCSDGRIAAHHFHDAIVIIRKRLYIEYSRQTHEHLWGRLQQALIHVPFNPESLAAHNFGIEDKAMSKAKQELAFVLEHQDGVIVSANKSFNAFKSWIQEIPDEELNDHINTLKYTLDAGENHKIPLSENPKLLAKLKHTLWALEHLLFLKNQTQIMKSEPRYPSFSIGRLLFARFCLQLLDDRSMWGPHPDFYKGV